MAVDPIRPIGPRRDLAPVERAQFSKLRRDEERERREQRRKRREAASEPPENDGAGGLDIRV